MELLRVEYPVLQDCQVVLLGVFMWVDSLTFHTELSRGRFRHILVLDSQYIFFVIVDDCEQFPLDFGEMFANIGFA